jgi:ABC-2 type transport system permease protein
VTGPPAEGPDTTLGSAPAVRLIARREIDTRLRSKAFRIATGLTVLILVALTVVLKFVNGGGGSDSTVGLVGRDAAVAAPLKATGTALGQTVTTRTMSEANGRQQIRDGTLDAFLATDGQQLTVVVNKNLDGKLKNALTVLAGQVALDQQISQLGGDPAQVDRTVAGARVHVQALQPPHKYQSQQLIVGIIAGILIYMSLMMNGQSVAQGVVEEKSSRVVELLLSTIRPWQLMAGKVLGIGVVGLLQMLAIGIAGVVAGLATGVLTISVSAAAGTLVWLVVWYLLGFFAYALAFAAVGALVSRQEDVGGVVAPVLMFVIIGYVLGISILPSNPGSPLVEVLSVIPMFAPTLMPMRLAMGGVPAWEAALAVVLVVALIPGLTWLAGRIYRNAVIRTGARVKLSDALRGN